MAVFFVLLMLIVQIGFGVASRSMVGASVDAATRRAAWGVDGAAEEESRLRADVEAVVPGATLTQIDVERDGLTVTVRVVYEWRPPGPDLLPLEFAVARTRTVVVAP